MRSTTYKLAVSAAAADIDLDSAEPNVIYVCADNATTHMILTPIGNAANATVNDFLLPSKEAVPFEVNRSLDRISAITEGASGNIYILVLTQ